MAERVFGLEESKVTLTYHLEDNRVTRSSREFYLPSVGEGQPLTMNTDMTSSYQVGVAGVGGAVVMVTFLGGFLG